MIEDINIDIKESINLLIEVCKEINFQESDLSLYKDHLTIERGLNKAIAYLRAYLVIREENEALKAKLQKAQEMLDLHIKLININAKQMSALLTTTTGWIPDMDLLEKSSKILEEISAIEEDK